jgi:hypothetical protein
MLTVGLSCGHGIRLLSVHDEPPEHDPWVTYPLIEEHPVEIGDQMTCIVDQQVRAVTGLYDATAPIDSDGKLRLP